MSLEYSAIKISTNEAETIAKELFNLSGEAVALDGEADFNFKIQTTNKNYLLKISRPAENLDYVDFQSKLLQHAATKNAMEIPEIILDLHGSAISKVKDENGEDRLVRLASWIEGRLWSSVNPITNTLLHSLGEYAGLLAEGLQDFEHHFAERYLEWDISNAIWCKEKLNMFEGTQKNILSTFLTAFEQIQPAHTEFRKSVIHNDVNDNNILVENELINPSVLSIIDYGDAVKTQTINDVAITLAYAIMHKEDPIAAAVEVVKGYHKQFPLLEEELAVLHVLVAMRLTITVTKSAMNKIAEPENEYHQISEKPAWKALEKWIAIHPELAAYHFRKACGFDAHPNLKSFKSFCSDNQCSLKELLPSINFEKVENIDMSVGSTSLGHEFEYNDLDLSNFKMAQRSKNAPTCLFAGGYAETRPFYCTSAYEVEGNCGPEYRTVHLGIDFCLTDQTPLHAFCDAEVHSVHDNNYDQDYGPTIILKHLLEEGKFFYSLFGHLSRDSLTRLQKGDVLKRGDLIGHIGTYEENGGWVPHLHFQLMLSMFDDVANFPGVATPNSIPVWKEICPDPALLFKELIPASTPTRQEELLTYRKQHAGKSLSVSYDQPLHMVRGVGVHLMDATGRRYLDTVNNVAHVGHEHPRIVKAGRKQMALLNTNTRYLHEALNNFTKELLSTLPDELSVVHFVNSGSEANELAMRMCRTVTKQKDMIAVEAGYHGNTQGCIDISSYKFDGEGGAGAPEHTHIVPLPDSFRGIYRGNEESQKYAAHIQEQVNNIKAKGRNVAGFICESIISCGGQIELPDNYLKTAYAAVRNEGGVCIADEVQVGIGRVGTHYWGFQLHDVIPDIVTIGKPLGNGHPLAAVICTQDIAEGFANGMEYFNTFGGNPVSCSIGLEVLRVVRDENLQKNAFTVGTYLKDSLRQLSSQFPILQDIRGQGLFLGFELADKDKKPLPKKAAYLSGRMKEFGILMCTDGKDNNAIKIKPPLVFSIENADELVSRIKTILNEDFIQKG